MKKLIGIAIITALFLAGCNLFPGEDDYITGYEIELIMNPEEIWDEDSDMDEYEVFVSLLGNNYPPSLNYGSISVLASVTAGLGTEVDLPDDPSEFIINGYTFKGWREADNNGNDDPSFSFTMPKAAPESVIQIEAVWEHMDDPADLSVPGGLLDDLLVNDNDNENIYVDNNEFEKHIFAYFNGTYYAARSVPEDGDKAANWKNAEETVSKYYVPKPKHNETPSWDENGRTWTLGQSSWRLPDMNLLALMYTNMHDTENGTDDFKDGEYWSSETGNNETAKTRDFSKGLPENDGEASKYLHEHFRPYISFKVTGQ